MAFSYRLITHARSGREHEHPYASQDPLQPGSVLLLSGRYWLVDRVDDADVHARPARYRLTLRHPDGREEAGAFRRFRPDAPTVGHQLATYENGEPVTWAVVEQLLARDDAGEPFLESVAERDHGEIESLPDHQLEHALEQDRDGAAAVSATLAQATQAGAAVELVALDPGQAPDWQEATRYLESLILEELEDDLIEECGVDTGRDPQERWLDTVKQRLRADLDSFLTDIEGLHDTIEEWDFQNTRIFAATGSFDDDSNPTSGYGWMCRLVDAGVLQAAGFYRARKPLLPL
jgi:hypothetical protein